MATKSLKEERTREPAHTSRAQDTYDIEKMHDENDKPWVRGQSLAAPEARPGMRQRWIRVGSLGADDPINVARKMREGWKPRPADSIPADFQLPSISHGQWAGCIGVEGMVLMEMPERLAAKRDSHFRAKTDNITNGIETELQAQSDPRMEISQTRKTKVGRLIKVADE